MTRLRVVTWNAEGMFVEGSKTTRALPHNALAVLRKLKADFVVVPEFGNIAAAREETVLAIRALGYEISLATYDDERSPGIGMAVLSRLPLISEVQHALPETGRPYIELRARGEAGEQLRIIGVHLDDRSEVIRMKQIASVISTVNDGGSVPTLVMGDFNAMHEKSLFAQVARSSIVGRLSARVKHDQLRSVAGRVHEMGRGTTIHTILTDTHLRDLDTKHRRTISAKQAGLEWAPVWRLAKIDWIFGTKHFKVINYKVHRDVGSDHRPVIADLQY